MRRGLILAGVLAGLCISGTGIAQAPDADELIERLREAAGEPRSAVSADELIERLREAAGDLPATAAPDAEADRPAIEGGLGPEQIRARIADDLGVGFRGVRAAETAAGPAYAVKIMNPPGNSNSALMVGTLVVDPRSGEVLGRAERFPSFSESAPLARDPVVGADGLEMRRRTYR